MRLHGYTLRESLKMLVQARDAVAPNPGFLSQLREMEAELFNGVISFPDGEDDEGGESVIRSAGKIKLSRFFPAAEG
jgi:hypothetical protein